MGLLLHGEDRSPSSLRTFFPPLSGQSLLSHYLPGAGAISHSLFTLHVFNPAVVGRLFGVGDLAISSTLLCTAHVGAGLYVFHRPHLKRAGALERVQFSVLASVLFNFGSLFAAMVVKAVLPARTWLRAVCGAVLSGALVYSARAYVQFVDSRSGRRRSPTPPYRNGNGHILPALEQLPHHPEPLNGSVVANGSTLLH